MNGTPKVNPKITKALKAFAVAEKKLREVVQLVQDKCDHAIVFRQTDWGDEMRICPVCGCEEHAPVYHTFLFEFMPNDDARLIVDCHDLLDHRINGCELFIRTSRG